MIKYAQIAQLNLQVVLKVSLETIKCFSDVCFKLEKIKISQKYFENF